ncbi:putative mucin TcMUCII [Trypanosoma cruzi]|uniref:Mucin TcMUCII, putative n=2 Tax=Trypanosoma cruzi TaxID=5693 RepID=Q4D6F2_TRYCC|nr:mucin TcMUCII, putative [Trypanosoma cruzi]EAN88103.1 mucin TcMUCII, putative [Trypanosoma cruzi]PWV19669.1 putative mucin TcMUCII [Trypanosoma cruzi]|eukprot:XP_809954.1 mucin TcMUCII [Trypanosoma cruzi strain CL Brener]
MMTCRLLCVLLVLALCCCPSVCAGDTQEVTEDQADIKDLNLSSLSPESKAAAPNGSVTGPAAPAPGGTPGNIQAAENSTTEPAAETIKPEAPVLADLETKVNTVPNTSLTEVTNGNKGSEIDTIQTADQTDNNVKVVTETTESITTTVSPENTKSPEGNGKGANSLPSASEDKQGTGNSGSSSLRSSAGSGRSAVQRDSTVTEPQSNNALNTTQTENNNGTTGPRSGTSSSADQTGKNAEDAAKTTTTTTTTHAQSTTTTEAPAVSTTRAPSRLREIDGSLSSSAWVCAPLLLAASALAYTTLG